jgi:hypothetical protein
MRRSMLHWVLGAVALLLLFLFHARTHWRRFIRQQVREALEARPDVQIEKEGPDSFEVRVGELTGTLYLGHLYAGLAGMRSQEQQKAAIRDFVDNALAAPPQDPLNLLRDGDRLMPRLFPSEALHQAPAAGPLPCRRSGLPGLVIAYVLDSERAVMYLTAKHLEELQLDIEALHVRAMENLRRSFAGARVRHALEQGSVQVVKTGDSFDATRILLVPEHLEAGEELLAVIPDRETLAFTRIEGADLVGLCKLARIPASPHTLLDRPVRITREGFATL